MRRLREFEVSPARIGIDVLFFSKQFQRLLTKQGLKFKLQTKVLSADKRDNKVFLKAESAKGGKEETVCPFIDSCFPIQFLNLIITA
jgi:hypothetical protein